MERASKCQSVKYVIQYLRYRQRHLDEGYFFQLSGWDKTLYTGNKTETEHN